MKNIDKGFKFGENVSEQKRQRIDFFTDMSGLYLFYFKSKVVRFEYLSPCIRKRIVQF